jgi:RNA polymerase sigma-70 factor (ECF subfamily)
VDRSNTIREFLEDRDALLGYIYALTRDFDVAEEIFQQVAIVLLEEPTGTEPIRDVQAFAREVARRRVAEFFRRESQRRKREQPSSRMLDLVGISFEENADECERLVEKQDALRWCLQKLPERARSAMNFRYGQRLALDAVAEHLGWTVDSVKVLLSRARKILAECVSSRLRLQEEA